MLMRLLRPPHVKWSERTLLWTHAGVPTDSPVQRPVRELQWIASRARPIDARSLVNRTRRAVLPGVREGSGSCFARPSADSGSSRYSRPGRETGHAPPRTRDVAASERPHRRAGRSGGARSRPARAHCPRETAAAAATRSAVAQEKFFDVNVRILGTPGARGVRRADRCVASERPTPPTGLSCQRQVDGSAATDADDRGGIALGVGTDADHLGDQALAHELPALSSTSSWALRPSGPGRPVPPGQREAPAEQAGERGQRPGDDGLVRLGGGPRPGPGPPRTRSASSRSRRPASGRSRAGAAARAA